MIKTLVSIFILGYIGYKIFNYLHFPSAAVAGPLITIAIITCNGFEWTEFPSYLTIFLQVIIGVVIGSRLKKEQVPVIKTILFPGLISSVWMILVSLLVGFLLARITGVEQKTALFGSVPAGLFEMGLIALSLNLNIPIVTLLQFSRVLSISFSLPLIVCKFKNIRKNDKISFYHKICDKKKDNCNFARKEKESTLLEVFMVLFLGSIGGFTAKYLNVPVGGMIGSMVMVGTLNILGVPLKEPPAWLTLVTRIMLGGYLGTSFVPEILTTLKSLLFPVLFFSFFIILNGILSGLVFHKILKWDLTTALLATAAGGITLMTLTAIELEADPIKVSIIQSLRIIIILFIMPPLISHFVY